jgi:lipopolysaccharide transport system permease protein
MGITLGLLLVPFGILFRDISYALAISGTGLMFLTPVIYPPPTHGLLAVITAYNPLTPLLMSARDFLVVGSSTYVLSMVVIMLITLVLLFASWVIFRLALPILIERIGA